MEIGTNFGRQLDDLAFAGSQRVDTPDLTQQDFLKLMIEQMRNQIRSTRRTTTTSSRR